MAISKIAGQMLKDNLERDGANLAISDTVADTPVVFVDVTNNRVGINNATPAVALDIVGNILAGNITTTEILSTGTANVANLQVVGNVTVDGNFITGNITIPATGNINVGTNYINNVIDPIQDQDVASKKYVDFATGNVGNAIIGNAIPLGTPTDSSLVVNVAYPGWTTATFVTDSIDDLNQVALNIANGTYVGRAEFTGTPTAGPSPMAVTFTGTYIGNPDSFLWDFGDGNTSTAGNVVVHTYNNVLGGQFDVTFTAFNADGTYSGNAALGAKGSTSLSTREDYITLYTPSPSASFTITDNAIDTGSSAEITNTSTDATSYELDWGDASGNIDIAGSWATQTHTYNNSANTDTRYGIVLSATSSTAGPSPVTDVSSTGFMYVYSEQSPAFSANTLTIVNSAATSGGIVSFSNDTATNPGTTAIFGAQQKYSFVWGDSNTSNVNVQSGLAGNPSAANVTHTFALTSGEQASGTVVNYTANLQLYTGYSTSPFTSSNIVISVEPEVRSAFTGAAVTQSDATGATAQTGYIYTDYNGNDRALFTYQNTSQNGEVFDYSWGDASTSGNINAGDPGTPGSGNITHTYSTTGSKTVALTSYGTPATIVQSNVQTRSSYITIATNPAAPGALSTKTLSLTTGSQGTSPLLAAAADDNTSGNIPAAGSSVTRYITSTPIISSTIADANTSLSTNTLTSYISGVATGNVAFNTATNSSGTYTSLVVTEDADAHTAINATYPTGFYKVFSARISQALASLSVGYNDYQLRHSTTGDTNAPGFVKDNLTVVPTVVTSSVTMAEATSGTYRYISGIPYYNTGSPSITVSSLAVANLTGQTYRSTTTPLTVASGTTDESTSGSIIGSQTKTYAQIDGSPTMLTGGIPNANVGIAANYTLGNQSISINGSARAVATLQASMINVNGTSTTVQLPTKVQVYSLSITGVDEALIPVSDSLGGGIYTNDGVRVALGLSGDTPAFSPSTNFYTSDAWSGAETVAGTDEAVVRWGSAKHFTTDLSTGYLPVGPDLNTGRSGTQYFTFAFQRQAAANFDIALTAPAGVAGVWIALPGSTIDTTVLGVGPTSTINGWIDCTIQYNGAGVPGADTGAGGNGSNGCALTGADIIPTGTAISNVSYTQTFGEQNMSNSTGNNVLVRIALSSGQSITAVSIGVAS
jgi:PKD repeat protein